MTLARVEVGRSSRNATIPRCLMSRYDNIFTNNALKKMRALGLSEALVIDVYNNGQSEESNIGGYNAIKKFSGYEIGVYYNRDDRGVFKIISVWKRNRR
jgi:hypothetical protein